MEQTKHNGRRLDAALANEQSTQHENTRISTCGDHQGKIKPFANYLCNNKTIDMNNIFCHWRCPIFLVNASP